DDPLAPEAAGLPSGTIGAPPQVISTSAPGAWITITSVVQTALRSRVPGLSVGMARYSGRARARLARRPMHAATFERTRPRPAAPYAASLPESLGAPAESPARVGEPHPALEWARSGAMALTGPADGPPRVEAAGVAVVARGAALALRVLAAVRGIELHVD